MQIKKITISSPLNDLPDEKIRSMAKIVANYFPDEKQMEETVRNHLKYATMVCLAMHENEIIGFSVASKYKMKTPFYFRPVNVIYQRMLYLDPNVLYRGLGLRLLSATMKGLFGWFWPFRRLVAFCRTQNPVVAKFMNMYNLAYPQYGQVLPAEIRKFAESLLPVLGAESVDESFRLTGTLSAFSGVDYTDTWNRYYHRRNNNYEKLMLSTAFKEKDGRIINSGAFLLMIAYARPLRFIRYLFHR